MSGHETAWRARAGSLALLLGSLALTLAAAEGVTRLVWEEPVIPQPPPRPPGTEHLPEIKGALELMEPNLIGVAHGVLYRTNSAGFRGREIAPRKAPGVFRIAITGDSFTMGQGVSEEAAYPALLESALNARADGIRYEVLNLGIGALNIRGAVARVKDLGLRFDADLLVYGATVNDIEGPQYRQTRGPTAGMYNYQFVSRSRFHLWRVLKPRIESLRTLVWPPADSYIAELNHNYFANPPAWADFVAQLDHLAAIAGTRGVCALVLVHPLLHHLNVFHPLRRHYAAIARAARARGLFVKETFSYFRGHDPRALWVSVVDFHPNADGHRLLAAALLDGLRELPPACGLGSLAPSAG